MIERCPNDCPRCGEVLVSSCIYGKQTGTLAAWQASCSMCGWHGHVGPYKLLRTMQLWFRTVDA